MNIHELAMMVNLVRLGFQVFMMMFGYFCLHVMKFIQKYQNIIVKVQN